ncbi:hypothetical protein PCE1_003392 [Barthelona sp. PCE]
MGITSSLCLPITSKEHQNDVCFGLTNISSNCYLNSLIQAFASSQNFYFAVTDHKIASLINKEEDLPSFTLALIAFILKWQKQQKFTVYTPITMTQHGISLFSSYHIHQDIHEALLRILEEFHSSAQELKLLFSGSIEHRYEYTCHSGISYNTEDFCSLALDVCEVTSLNQLLSAHIARTESDIHCEDCETDGKLVVSSSFVTLPAIFVITLKRFTYENGTRKISAYVHIPSNLNLHSHRYKLLAVIAHIGTPCFGHYVCFALRDEQWYLFDDDKCVHIAHGIDSYLLRQGPMSFKDDCMTPYMIFYEQTQRY